MIEKRPGKWYNRKPAIAFRTSINYRPWYTDLVPCDFCGQHTRGRVYDGANQVVCGSCNTVLVDDVEKARPDWG